MDTFELKSNSDIYFLDLSDINEKIYLCNNLIKIENKIKLIKNKIIKHNNNKNIIKLLKEELSKYVLLRNTLINYINPNETDIFKSILVLEVIY